MEEKDETSYVLSGRVLEDRYGRVPPGNVPR